MINLLGYDIYNKSKSELVPVVMKTKDKLHIISGNPEVLSNGLQDETLWNNFHENTSIIIPDAAGVILSAKYLKKPVEEKIAGIELFEEILSSCEKENKGVYLLGSTDEILELCISKITNKFPTITIVGSHNGYFDLNNCEDIITDINNSKPFVTFVAMGCPRQEKFIIQYMNKLNCTVFMGIGGAFDVMSGKLKRAPGWMIKMNLEWLYRVAKEPFRIKRLGIIPKFMYKAIKHKEK